MISTEADLLELCEFADPFHPRHSVPGFSHTADYVAEVVWWGSNSCVHFLCAEAMGFIWDLAHEDALVIKDATFLRIAPSML